MDDVLVLHDLAVLQAEEVGQRATRVTGFLPGACGKVRVRKKPEPAP